MVREHEKGKIGPRWLTPYPPGNEVTACAAEKGFFRDDGDGCTCFQLIEQARFDGVITLIYEGKGDEWAGVDQLRAALQPLL